MTTPRLKVQRAAKKAGWSDLGITVSCEIRDGRPTGGFWADWSLHNWDFGDEPKKCHHWTERIRVWGETSDIAVERMWVFAARLLNVRLPKEPRHAKK